MCPLREERRDPQGSRGVGKCGQAPSQVEDVGDKLLAQMAVDQRPAQQPAVQVALLRIASQSGLLLLVDLSLSRKR